MCLVVVGIVSCLVPNKRKILRCSLPLFTQQAIAIRFGCKIDTKERRSLLLFCETLLFFEKSESFSRIFVPFIRSAGLETHQI